MADDQSMTVRAAASKLLVEEHADVLREAVQGDAARGDGGGGVGGCGGGLV